MSFEGGVGSRALDMRGVVLGTVSVDIGRGLMSNIKGQSETA